MPRQTSRTARWTLQQAMIVPSSTTRTLMSSAVTRLTPRRVKRATRPTPATRTSPRAAWGITLRATNTTGTTHCFVSTTTARGGRAAVRARPILAPAFPKVLATVTRAAPCNDPTSSTISAAPVRSSSHLPSFIYSGATHTLPCRCPRPREQQVTGGNIVARERRRFDRRNEGEPWARTFRLRGKKLAMDGTLAPRAAQHPHASRRARYTRLGFDAVACRMVCTTRDFSGRQARTPCDGFVVLAAAYGTKFDPSSCTSVT